QNDISLTKEQWMVLMQLWVKDGISQQIIADATGKDKPSMTRLLDNLERDAYIQRRPDFKDRRLNLIFLTNKGLEMEKKVMPVAEAALAELTHGLTSQEINTMKDVFNKIYNNIGVL
ncbi:MarR family winged helix-turn-helix transcriptional regulator, partial [Pedobacter sp.]